MPANPTRGTAGGFRAGEKERRAVGNQLRDSGVSALGSVPWGTHICHFYSTKDEMTEVLVPYFRAGLRSNESCIWVCSSPLGVDEAAEALDLAVPGLDRYLDSGQMRIIPYDRWYLDADGQFRAERVHAAWKEALAIATAVGYAGLRVGGNTSWLNETTWRPFFDYEDRLYGVVGPDPMLAICSYPIVSGLSPFIMEVAGSHQYALFRRDTGWSAVACGKHWKKEWEQLFDNTAEAILIVDERERIISANGKTLRHFGARSLRDLGGSLAAFSRRFGFHREFGDGEFTLLNILRGTQGQWQYWRASSRDGRDEIHLRVSVRRLKSRSRLSTRYLILLDDVTDLRAAEKSKQEFLNVLGHELRNPIQVMTAAMPLLERMDAPGNPSLRRYVDILSGQVKQLSSLVEDLLTLCRIEGQRLEVNLRIENLADLTSEWMASYAGPQDHSIIPRYSRTSELTVAVDKVRIWEILGNLASNAVKYSPPGTSVWVDIRTGPGEAVVLVEDEGIGIPEDEMAGIFEPFARGSNAVRLGRQGTGLGLYISRQLARLHGGDLWAERRRGGGTIMKLRLPLFRGEASQVAGRSEPTGMPLVGESRVRAKGASRQVSTSGQG